jgi:excinuclease ABC subunit B
LRVVSQFQLTTEFKPAGDQPEAIAKLSNGLRDGKRFQCLLGVTGSGKTFTIANVIAQAQRPTLVLSHNKTLAAQLYEEFRDLFQGNAVSYFVSYYDYYQPEAYIPQRDIYIEKDASRNDDLDRLRLAATSALVSRRDVVIVSSVSCIFGLGSPDDYKNSTIIIHTGETHDRDGLLKRFVDLQYSRNDIAFTRGTFRVRGDTVEVYPAYEEFAYRIEMFGDEVENIEMVNPTTGASLGVQHRLALYPAVHYVMPEDRVAAATESILAELEQRLMALRRHGKLLEAQRLAARTKYDVEMIREVGYCSGIENYARHLNGTPPGARPYTLIDYFPEDLLVVIDESHVSIPQVRAMYNGDRARKTVLVEHGFRLPSCLDNRPLKFDEFHDLWKNVIFVSATPGPYELEKCEGEIVEQVVRPTGLVDPVIHLAPARGQVPDLLQRAAQRAAAGERVLVTTLTKRLAEDLSRYLEEEGLRSKYLHSEIDTLERITILNGLRSGVFDVLVGVNLLREGLDLPEVSLVCILDADKEGFLRSETSLVQMIGRTARNVNAEVVLYGDKMTPSMERAIQETERRRSKQLEYNQEHGITPETIKKAIRSDLQSQISAREIAIRAVHSTEEEYERDELIALVEKEMLEAAEKLEFERAAELHEKLKALQEADADTPAAVTLADIRSNQKVKTSRSKIPRRKPT